MSGRGDSCVFGGPGNVYAVNYGVACLIYHEVGVPQTRAGMDIRDIDLWCFSVDVYRVGGCRGFIGVDVFPVDVEGICIVYHEHVGGCVGEPGLTAYAGMGVHVWPGLGVIPLGLAVCPVVLLEG